MLSSMPGRFDGALERGMARVLEVVECPRVNGRLVEDRNRFVVHALSLDEPLFVAKIAIALGKWSTSGVDIRSAARLDVVADGEAKG